MDHEEKQLVSIKSLWELCERLYHAENNNRDLTAAIRHVEKQRDDERKWSYLPWILVFVGMAGAFWVGTKTADVECYHLKQQQQRQGDKKI